MLGCNRTQEPVAHPLTDIHVQINHNSIPVECKLTVVLPALVGIVTK
jgi:hypothetical protein